MKRFIYLLLIAALLLASCGPSEAETPAPTEDAGTDIERTIAELRESISELEKTIAKQEKTTPDEEEATTEPEEVITDQGEIIAKQQEIIAELQKTVIKQQETIAQFRESITELELANAQKDEIIKKLALLGSTSKGELTNFSKEAWAIVGEAPVLLDDLDDWMSKWPPQDLIDPDLGGTKLRVRVVEVRKELQEMSRLINDLHTPQPMIFISCSLNQSILKQLGALNSLIYAINNQSMDTYYKAMDLFSEAETIRTSTIEEWIDILAQHEISPEEAGLEEAL